MQARWLVRTILLVGATSLCADDGRHAALHTPDEQTSVSREDEGRDRDRHTWHGPVGFVFDGTLQDVIEFFTPHKSGNGRSCATCHRPEDHFGLTPTTVEARYQALQARRQYDPHADDPLFRSIDADDFDQDFTTLRTKALVRVVLPLPLNVTLADDPQRRPSRSGGPFRPSSTPASPRHTRQMGGWGRWRTRRALPCRHTRKSRTSRKQKLLPGLPNSSTAYSLRGVCGNSPGRWKRALPCQTPLPHSLRSSNRGRPHSSISALRATAARRKPSTPMRAFYLSPSEGRCLAHKRSSTSSCKPPGPRVSSTTFPRHIFRPKTMS